MSWRTPDTYHRASIKQGTATFTSTRSGTTSTTAASLLALILLCQFGEVCDEDRVEASGEKTFDASDDFAV